MNLIENIEVQGLLTEIPAFKQAIFKLLLKEGKISKAVIENMNSWVHDGFHVYCGKAIYSWDNEGLERLGQYIVRAPLSQERMTYIPEDQTNDGRAKVVYKGKTSKKTQVFSALDSGWSQASLLLAYAS